MLSLRRRWSCRIVPSALAHEHVQRHPLKCVQPEGTFQKGDIALPAATAPMLKVNGFDESLEKRNRRKEAEHAAIVVFPVGAMEVFGNENSAWRDEREELLKGANDVLATVRAVINYNVKLRADIPHFLDGRPAVMSPITRLMPGPGRNSAMRESISHHACVWEIFASNLKRSTILYANFE